MNDLRACVVVLLALTSGAAAGQSFSVVSRSAQRELSQDPAAGGCTLRCRNLETKQELWTANVCIAARGDRVFVDDHCEHAVVFFHLPDVVARWQTSPVVRVYKRGEKTHEFLAMHFVRAERKVRMLTRKFEWLAGLNSARGVPPRLRDDGLGVDFEAIDGTRHMMPFEPGLERVELLNAGAEPRSPLRYAFKKGVVEKGTLTQELEVTSELVGRTRDTVKDPPFTIAFAVTHGPLDKKGNFTYGFRLTDIKVDTAAIKSAEKKKALATAIKDLKRQKGTASTDARGRAVTTNIEVAEDESRFKDARSQNINKALSDAMPFPEAPVGVGARWRSTYIDASGQDLVRADFELVERSGDTAVLKVFVVQESYSRNLVLPDLPPGVSAWIDRARVTVTALRKMDLTRAIPDATAEANGDIVLTVQGRDRSADVKVKSRAKLQLSGAVTGSQKVAAPRPP